MNGQRFTLQSTNSTHVTLKDGDVEYKVPVSEFEKPGNFGDGFCDSVFRYQGRTIREPYNIYDISKMSLQDLYVALSRFTTSQHIFFDAEGLEDRVFIRQKPPTLGQTLKLKPVTYRIYRITAVDESDNGVYIGYTYKTLAKRFQEHKDTPTNVKMRQWLPLSEKRIELIEEISFMTLSDVKRREAKYIAAISKERSKNVQHQGEESTATKVKPADLTKRCNFVVPGSRPVKPQKPPKVTYDTKNKRYKIQQRIDGKNATVYGKTKQDALEKLEAKRAEIEENN
jgi:hypothetical protein